MNLNRQQKMAVAAATLRGLCSAIMDADFTEPMAFEGALSIGAQIERIAGEIVADADRARFEGVWGTLAQEAEYHRLALEVATIRDTNSPAEDEAMDRIEEKWNALSLDKQAELEAILDAEILELERMNHVEANFRVDGVA